MPIIISTIAKSIDEMIKPMLTKLSKARFNCHQKPKILPLLANFATKMINIINNIYNARHSLTCNIAKTKNLLSDPKIKSNKILIYFMVLS